MCIILGRFCYDFSAAATAFYLFLYSPLSLSDHTFCFLTGEKASDNRYENMQLLLLEGRVLGEAMLIWGRLIVALL